MFISDKDIFHLFNNIFSEDPNELNNLSVFVALYGLFLFIYLFILRGHSTVVLEEKVSLFDI